MPTPLAASSVSDGLYRFSGMYGSVWRDGVQLSEAVEFTGAVEVGRIEVPLVGQTKTGYKPGRETREGTLRIQKIDTKWEMELYSFLATNLRQRRANRDRGTGSLRPFSLMLEYDDPDALGIEKWQLDGCLIWRLPLGFSIGDDLVEREFPVTWENERPIYAFRADDSGAGTPKATWYDGYGPPPPAS
jgi:hypothetical protein